MPRDTLKPWMPHVRQKLRIKSELSREKLVKVSRDGVICETTSHSGTQLRSYERIIT